EPIEPVRRRRVVGVVPVARPEEDPELQVRGQGERRRAVDRLRWIVLPGRRGGGRGGRRGEEALTRPAARRPRGDVELPDLPAYVADVDPVDVSVAVQVHGGRVPGDAEGHVLPVVARAVVVVLPELRASREVDDEERLAEGVVLRRVVPAPDERDELVGSADLHLTDGG